jgi:formyl-CoA transferase
MDEQWGPLEGLTVVEVGTMVSVPTAGRLLADFGATVIKIEHPDGGDHSRDFGPQKDGTGVWWKYLGRNKKSATLDLKSDEGQELFVDLVREADVLLENFRPGTLERWGIGYETLSAENPGLVMLRLSGFGQDGPYAERPGFGTLAEAMSGYAYLNGFQDRPPLLPPTGLADQVSALFGVFSVMFALYHREVNDGGGQYIDASLIESLLQIAGPQPMRYEELDDVEKRSGNQSTSSAPRNVYETGDGRWVALAASAQPLAMRVFDAIGRPDLKDDPRFEDNESRVEHKDELDEIIGEWIGNRTREEVVETFEEHDAAIAPVYNIEDIMNDEHYEERNAIVEVQDDEFGETPIQNVFPKFSSTPGEIRHLGPGLGEHNDEVFCGMLGLDESELERMNEEGVV